MSVILFYFDSYAFNILNLILTVFCLDGRMEEVLMDKITSRIQNLCDGLNMDFIDPVIQI